jgi:phospholipid/cholesterol/gamma-HCH transport system ATP-binding protein
MLFQKNALFDSLSVLENLLYPLKEALGEVGAQAKERSLDLLHSVGLSEMRDLFPNELSGGMQKRLGIARALVVRPEVLICDEPTAGLDPITSRKIADLLVESRKKENFTLISVTNEPRRALELGDRVAVFVEGRLQFSGQDPRVERFLRGEA